MIRSRLDPRTGAWRRVRVWTLDTWVGMSCLISALILAAFVRC